MLRWLLWSPVLVTVLSAFLIPGIGLVVFLLPLGAIGWGLFSLIAWLGPDHHERS